MGGAQSVALGNDRLESQRIHRRIGAARVLVSRRDETYQFGRPRRVETSTFIGVGRGGDGAPAFGWYGGVGVQTNDVTPKWDVGFDWRRYDKISRNRVLPTDYPPTRDLPRIRYDVKGYSFYLSRRF